MMKSYLLGIDIGTSGCKVAVFDKEGKVLAAANGDYPVYYPQEGWAEQNPEEWWSAVCRATKETVQKAGIDPAEIAGAPVILPQFAPEEGLGVHPQELREPGQEGDVRGSRPALPFADGLAADAELFPQLRLGEVQALRQGPDEAAGFDLIHGWFLRFSLR